MSSDPSGFRPELVRRQPSFRISTRQLGMLLFLVSLAVLFLASVVAYLITRSQHPNWTAVEAVLPGGLLAAGVFLVGTSAGVEYAIRGVRKNRQTQLRHGLVLAGVFALGFLVTQGINWRTMLTLNASDQTRLLSLFVFYMLTALHALHVIGGFVPLWLVWRRAVQREYSSSRWEGVKLCAQYWHFLGVVWVILMAVMYGL